MAKAMVDQPLNVPGHWPPQGRWTYEDYRRLPDNGWRYEVLRGELFMNPAPRPRHQEVVLQLAGRLDEFVGKHDQHDLGKVYIAPIDFMLGQLATPVQPDVTFVRKDCLGIVEETLVRGAPDFVAEVLSPSSAKEDREGKRDIYEEAGVREYWIIDPDARTIDVLVLEGAQYRVAARAGPDETVRSVAVPGFAARVAEICPL